MSPACVLVERDDGVGIVTINRPEVLNALNQETKRLLTEAFAALAQDPEIRAIVLTGAGDRAFCAGQDIRESAAMDAQAAVEWVAGFDHLYQSIRQCLKPVVAAVRGWAVGSGFQIALLADLRIAAPSARFAMTEVDVGIPCITGSSLLWPLLGRARTLDLILTAKVLSAQEALAWGVVSEVVDAIDPVPGAIAVARTLGSKAARAIRWNKKWLNDLTEDVYQRGIATAKAAHGDAYGAGDAAEHMERFLSKQRQSTG